jgi:hypothetical protein
MPPSPTVIPSQHEYPEHEKMRAVKEESQRLGEFLDWALNTRKPSIRIPKFNGIEALLAEYFEIDLKKVSEEKDQMVEELRRANAGHRRKK